MSAIPNGYPASATEAFAMRHLEFQHHDGDDDGDNAITERFESSLVHD